jgi:hypothetical protein
MPTGEVSPLEISVSLTFKGESVTWSVLNEKEQVTEKMMRKEKVL